MTDTDHKANALLFSDLRPPYAPAVDEPVTVRLTDRTVDRIDPQPSDPLPPWKTQFLAE